MPSPSEFSQVIIPYLTTIGIHICPCKTSPWQKDPRRVPPARGLFGVPLHLLPVSQKVEGVPEFLVEACELLRPHLHIEGLFRKCGSTTRIKALKARLEAGEHCLHMALPCDVAALVKQFLRSLPEPLIPAGLQAPLCQVQRQGGEDGGSGGGDRDLLTLLLTCLFPLRNANILCYFLTFLQDVVAKCAQNKMDLANLAVIFAPNLFSGETCGQLGAGAEEQLQRQAAVTRILISHASEIGTIPQPLLEKVHAASSGMESKRLPPRGQEAAGGSSMEGRRRRRRSVSNLVSEALSKFKSGRALCTPPGQEAKQNASSSPKPRASFGSKRKASEDAAELSVKKRRSALGSADSDPLDGVGDLSDQPVALSSAQGLASPAPECSEDPLHPACLTGSLQTPTSKVQWKQSRCGKRPPRKPSSSAAPYSCSPVSFEQKQSGPRSLGIFSRTSKVQEPLSSVAKTAGASGWFLVKRKRQGAVPEWACLQSYKLRENSTGSSSWFSSKNTDVHIHPSQRALNDMKSKRLAEPNLPLEVLHPGPPEQKLGAPAGRRGLLGKTEAPAERKLQAMGHGGVFRRSLSWPEELSLREATEERGFFPEEASISPELAQPGMEAILAGMKKLGILEAPSTVSDCPVASCSGSQPSRLAPRPFPSKPELPDAGWGLAGCFRPSDEPPQTALQRLALNFHHSLSPPSKEPRSLPKPPSGRRFGRSVSHESGLPLPDGVSAGGTPKRSAKTPLQHFKACGRQLFLTRKHLGVSFAGLCSRREPAKPKGGFQALFSEGDRSPNPHPAQGPLAAMHFGTNPD